MTHRMASIVVLVGGIVLLKNGQAAGQVSGSGTPGTVPVWTGDGTVLTDSRIQDNGSTVTVQVPVNVSGRVSGTTSDGGDGVAGSVAGFNNAATEGGRGVTGTAVGPNGYGVLGDAEGGVRAYGVFGYSMTGVGVAGRTLALDPDGAGVLPVSDGSGPAILAVSDISGPAVLARSFFGSGSILEGWGGSSPNNIRVFRVDTTGQVFASAYNTGGADFAESMAVSGERSRYEPGDVVIIEESGTRQVALAREPYSTLVAGIYSTKPGILATPYAMDDPRLLKEIPLAVVGIVPCKVTAENGAIKRGDLLVTSSVPGHAMKGTDRNRMLGAVVGKALEPLASGTGVIEVLVTLQ